MTDVLGCRVSPRRFSLDVLLTNIMFYWVTGAIGPSSWPYYERRQSC